jgi:hypothetical protein
MKSEKIYSEDGKAFTRVFSIDKIERVNPVEYFQDHYISNSKLGSIKATLIKYRK